MPAVGFGTWEIFPDEKAERVVSQALRLGYRLIDTAKIYSNERGVGRAVRESGIPREEIFVTTKLWEDDHAYDAALRAYDAALERLGLDYVDLYLIHWPRSEKRAEAWRALEDMYKSGRIKAIGVSNYTVPHLEELLKTCETVPMVNQVEFHPFIFNKQQELLAFCKERNIQVEAYSPLSHLMPMVGPELRHIAKQLGKSPSQVVLRWCLQHGAVPLPRSTNPEHIRENLEIFDFELSDDQVQAIDRLSK